MRAVTLAEVQAKLAEGRAAVVNVLIPDYFRAARIPGSVNLPLDEIRARAASVFPARDREIITYCGSDT